MRKWDEPPSRSNVPPIADPSGGEGQVRLRARVFRRWISGGAEPGGLRALAGDAADQPERRRKFAPSDDGATDVPR